jgi:hypothetical protein
VADAGAQLGDSVRSLLQDLVVHDIGTGVLRSAAPGDAGPYPGSLNVVGLGYLDCTCRALLALCPAHQLEVGGGQGIVYVFTGHHHGEVAS